MKYRIAGALLMLTLIAVPMIGEAALEDARRDIAQLRYSEAERELIDVARSSDGRIRQEALFLLAGLKNSVDEAVMIYSQVIEIAADNEWGRKSQVELAKIEYAVGHYTEAFGILEESAACRASQEACYFQGLSAVMLKRYADARDPLERVRKGAYRPWAFLALAEIDMQTLDVDAACRKYRSMARSGLSPTAAYRYGECLEKDGELEDAKQVFESIVREFRNTPEAVLAAQKLDAITGPASRPVLEPAEAQRAPDMTGGFTLQFGSFHARENAIKLMAELRPELPGVRIDSDLLNYREVHRVRFGYFATRAEAQKRVAEIQPVIKEPISIMTLQ